MSARLSIDIGGTFTDVVLAHAGGLSTTKVLTTYDDPARGVLEGIGEVLQLAGVAPAEVSLVLHGTTLATNALIERRGAKTAMFTTAGHRDVIEMALENRFEQYDVNIDRPQPLVPRHLRLPVAERMAADGTVLIDLDESGIGTLVEQCLQQGVTSIAVCLLHSYANPQHEQAVGRLLARQAPELSVTLSSEVCPEIREYERFSTTVANAYVKPIMATYLHSLAAKVQALGIPAQILLMTSGGGLTTLETAARFPIRLVESGPAGGAMLAANLAQQQHLAQVVSFDMGGTTAKICLIDNGQPLHSRAFEVDRSYRFKKGSGLPVRIPVVEMVEIGAGGGSLASVDPLGRLLVGPASAGSEPGPACYGRGGRGAAVTDADVLLGKLSADHFAGGKLRLDRDAAAVAVQQAVAAPLALADVTQAAHSVGEIVEENMASAARAHAAEWGRDMPTRVMIAFGGAAPLHAAGLARKLKISKVLIPADAGVGSALGFLLAPVSFEVVRSAVCLLDDLVAGEARALLDDMQAEAAAILDSARIDAPRRESIHCYMRYAGQGYEIAVPTSRDLSSLADAFATEYKKLYGRTIPGLPVEIISWTLSLSADYASPTSSPTPDPATALSVPAGGSQPQPLGQQAYFDGVEQRQIDIYARHSLTAEHVVEGPALIVEDQTTTVVPAHSRCCLLPDHSLLLEITG